ncbi:DNA adenine methylase [Bdellovibrio sp. SKB1291214]|uniref:DNA adenine methylase n=1 Tax=Bdellovibrio sp. SKB1291214 TaxID=1732569 RepID=UPI000B519234|nr:DNA adenine methylase [Bdellovibrio sp. SKB1291214]UYL09435.1 DNA adenine methylase [Bdellovibrio sp. SKB1291214]
MDIQTINSERRIELRTDEKYLHVMKYMGSKRELLPDIKSEVDSILKGQGGVLDLFAGTGSVGLYLQDSYSIVSNDIQSYSRVICEALIGAFSPSEIEEFKEKLIPLRKKFELHRWDLSTLLGPSLKESNRFVQIPKRGWTEELRHEYLKFFATFPNPTNGFKTPSADLENLWRLYQERSTNQKQYPYVQTTLLFAEAYFSLQQAIDIDSLRYAIQEVFHLDSRGYHIAMTALLYAHSYCSSGTGHFATYRDLKTLYSITDVFLYRDRVVYDYFLKKLIEIFDYLGASKGNKGMSLAIDYRDVLASDELAAKYDLIYADPPYSFVHYSRFYHATESLVKYDYQLPQYKGRYRTDRHQSPFCQGMTVQSAFEEIFKWGALRGKAVLLSYSNTGMISQEAIIKTAQKYGYRNEVKEVHYEHSTLGREGHKSNQIKELLITFSV